MKILDDHTRELVPVRSLSSQDDGDTPANPAEEDPSAAETPVGVTDARRAQESGSSPQMWRSFGELADSDSFRAVVENEFPRYAPQEWEDGPSRRSFLKVAGASVGLAGLAACTRQPRERIIPYVEQPENLVPGKPLFFATAMPHRGFAVPLLAESHMGRPDQGHWQP